MLFQLEPLVSELCAPYKPEISLPGVTEAAAMATKSAHLFLVRDDTDKLWHVSVCNQMMPDNQVEKCAYSGKGRSVQLEHESA